MNTKQILRDIREGKADHPLYYPEMLEILEDDIARVEKQIDLLEDTILVYHTQRAPTRRAWYIGVGNCRGDRAKWILQDFKDEYAKRGQNGEQIDKSEDIFLPKFANDNNGSVVENIDAPTTWDGAALLETFYSKRARLLSLYGRLYTAVEKADWSEIIAIICDAANPRSWAIR